MANCRSVPPEGWAHAREALVRYFISRHGRSDAEDLAQKTLLKVWQREDFQFERIADFSKVCLGFARIISLEGYRAAANAPSALDFDVEAPEGDAEGQRAAEARILLDEVLSTGAKRLKPREWRAILDWMIRSESRGDSEGKLPESNRDRVYLHRARQKLREMTGWRDKREKRVNETTK